MTTHKNAFYFISNINILFFLRNTSEFAFRLLEKNLLRGMNGRGHFETKSIPLRKRVLFKYFRRMLNAYS